MADVDEEQMNEENEDVEEQNEEEHVRVLTDLRKFHFSFIFFILTCLFFYFPGY